MSSHFVKTATKLGQVLYTRTNVDGSNETAQTTHTSKKSEYHLRKTTAIPCEIRGILYPSITAAESSRSSMPPSARSSASSTAPSSAATSGGGSSAAGGSSGRGERRQGSGRGGRGKGLDFETPESSDGSSLAQSAALKISALTQAKAQLEQQVATLPKDKVALEKKGEASKRIANTHAKTMERLRASKAQLETDRDEAQRKLAAA